MKNLKMHHVALLGAASMFLFSACGEEAPTPEPPCDFTVCVAPGPSCDGDSVVTQNWSGSCAVGQCIFLSDTEDCVGGCSNGECVDPCEAVTCTAETVTVCDDDETLVETIFSGVCEGNGTCVSTEETTDCSRNGRVCEDDGDEAGCVIPEPLQTCDDELVNGDESDEDCGGPDCDPCADGLACIVDDDCVSEICAGDLCVPPNCEDGLLNGGETGIDCGGSCVACGTGEPCGEPSDCESAVCAADGCRAASCEDAVVNGLETDRDCGGEDCGPCGLGDLCSVGTDCFSSYCAPSRSCEVPTCLDFVQNQGETGVDCGGAACGPCISGGGCLNHSDCVSDLCFEDTCVDASCTNGFRSELETDVDCGGRSCAACEPGGSCELADDCTSGVCSGGACAVGTCTDSARDVAESDVDCGGVCDPCEDGLGCFDDFSCTSRVCGPFLTCEVPTCRDDRTNGSESDRDCGGFDCDSCAVGRRCIVGDDCASTICTAALRCTAAATCSDLRRNGTETDVDCGGEACSPCPQFRSCVVNADCLTDNCSFGRCGDFARCDDGIQNGGESDVDCGGPRCDTCRLDAACSIRSDCETGLCSEFVCVDGDCTNEIMDGSETDVDCGGGCLPCPPLSGCLNDRDCEGSIECLELDAVGEVSCGASSAACICAPDHCFNGFPDAGESDIDCGGRCPRCDIGEVCRSDDHCETEFCDEDTGTCGEALCTNGVLDPSESDIDCGNFRCGLCELGEACVSGGSCISDRCREGVCFSLCANELLDPGESDVDCGGECEPCNNGDSCFVNENCASNSCVGATRESHDDAEAGVCRAPTCSDDALNSDEEGIDCGGSCGGAPCPLECDDESVWYNVSDFADADGGVTDEHFIILPGGLDLYRSGDPECAARSVGYTERVIRFTAPLTGVWVFSTVGRHTNFDSIIYAYFETCATGAVEMGCNDDAVPGESASTLELRLTEGDVIFLVVDGAPVLMDREFVLNIQRED